MTDSFDWDAVPDVALDGRSILKHPSVAPNGMEWHEYFNLLKEEGAISYGEAKVEEGPPDPGKVYGDWGPVRITQEAEEFDDPIGPLATYVKLAHKGGWEIVSLAHALSFAEGLAYKTGAKEGTIRADRNIELQWAHFKRNRQRASVCFTIINDKVQGTATARLFGGVQQSDAEMKEKMKQ